MAADGTFGNIADKWGLSSNLCIGDALSDNAQPQQSGTDVFTVGFDSEFPPYGYKDESGEYVGFDLDLAQEVCNRRGWILVKQPIDWDSKDMELKTGAIDCIWNGFTIDGREDDYTWSIPYIDNSQVIVVKSDSGITDASGLAGKVVAVQTDSSALAALTGEDATEENKALCASFSELQQVGDYNSAFLNLETGAVDAICLDVGVASYEVNARKGFVILDAPISSEKYGVGFLKGNTVLRDEVQTTMLEMAADGTFNDIADKWGLTSSVCIDEEALTAADSETDAAEIGQKPEKSFAERLGYMTGAVAKGLLTSLAIFLLTLLFALPLGLLIAAGRMSRLKILSSLIKLYISVVRGTPLMLQLLVVFFGPYYLFGVRTSSGFRFTAVIIGFSLNYAAYFAEIYRSGIQAVPRGQYEAADILGYTKMQRFFKIVFPQMVKNILPSMTNEIITLVKDTSLAFAVSCTEMFTLAKQVAAAEATILPLFIAGVFYYVFNAVVAFLTGRAEHRLNYFR
ncbi:MAG: ABC transporter permease subunit [Oscillospiraceae bacterium]|nr:ABC transporter permease subunit [Oscillospiraceae bacterium]